VRGFIEAVGADLARRAPAVSIGPVTSDAVKAAGIPLGVEADAASIDALTDATIRLVREAKSASATSYASARAPRSWRCGRRGWCRPRSWSVASRASW